MRKLNVLFLCTGNSARSILAEAILGREGKDRFNAYSAGSQPRGKVHPYALDLLDGLNFLTRDFRSKSWDEFAGKDAPVMDFVFSVCGNAANEVYPVWPGRPLSAHWGMPDPAAVEGSEADKRLAFAETYHGLHQRISILINLPFESLDPPALQRQLEKIARQNDTAAGDALT